MTESEFLERFDAHILRMDDHIVRADAMMAEIREEMRLGRADRADLRTFTRDLIRRNEIVLGDVSRNLAELNEQSRAQTAANLSVLDRLN